MIFILDDDQSVRTSLTRLLRSAGYEARAFADADECLADIDAAGLSADCVIIDLHMPGMGGLQLQAVINRREPPVPVIVFSATEDVELRAVAVAAGAVKVLRKPCDSGVLLRAVADAIGGPSPSPVHVASADPDHFVLDAGHARYHPVGTVSFDRAVTMIRAAIAAAHRNGVRDLLVDISALTGFPSPDTFERFLAVVEWAEEARGNVRLAMVARAEMIHPQRLGVLVAANRGLVSNIFATEAEARAWLARRDVY